MVTGQGTIARGSRIQSKPSPTETIVLSEVLEPTAEDGPETRTENVVGAQLALGRAAGSNADAEEQSWVNLAPLCSSVQLSKRK